MKNVALVVDEGLCTGCGTCAAMCPQDAISICRDSRMGVYAPFVSEARCSGCGTCLKVCPGRRGESSLPSEKSLSEFAVPSILGADSQFYVGWATSESIRNVSSSGGLVTALLVHALESGIIDGVVVTRMKRESPLEPEPIVARTAEEVVEAAASKYCPVPANIALREILEEDGRYAVVGLPCHIQGVRLAQRANKLIKDRVILCLGLACHHTPSFLGTEYILSSLGVDPKEVVELRYRGSGWPGQLTVATRTGEELYLDYASESYWGFLLRVFFIPRRCLVCIDKTSFLSDLTFMDSWNLASPRQGGTGIVVARTREGKAVLESGRNMGDVSLSEVTRSEVMRSLNLRRELRRRFASVQILRRKTGFFPWHAEYENCARKRDTLTAAVMNSVNSASFDRRFWVVLHFARVIYRVVRKIRQGS
jgi:coenzyme F420 hydrogenase subunit beta